MEVAAGATRVDIDTGPVAHNGGSLNGLKKSLNGLLTTGNFAHSNIVHISGSARTLTLANSNRGDYAGLAATAYAVNGQLA